MRMSTRTTTSKTFDALNNDTIDVVFVNWVSRSAVTVESDRAKDYADRDLGSPNYYSVH